MPDETTPLIEAPPLPLPATPVALATELAVSCPERALPAYPAVSRRLGEEGTVVLRVELDKSGSVFAAHINSSGGHAITALGLAVAIPAVLAYNAFQCRNRIWLNRLESFAHRI